MCIRRNLLKEAFIRGYRKGLNESKLDISGTIQQVGVFVAMAIDWVLTDRDIGGKEAVNNKTTDEVLPQFFDLVLNDRDIQNAVKRRVFRRLGGMRQNVSWEEWKNEHGYSDFEDTEIINTIKKSVLTWIKKTLNNFGIISDPEAENTLLAFFLDIMSMSFGTDIFHANSLHPNYAKYGAEPLSQLL